MFTHLTTLLSVLTLHVRRLARDEKGFSVSVEKLLLVIGVIAIAGLVIGALTVYVQGLLSRLN
ncbi:MAG: hypothetical protein IPL43_00130 [Micropruina sp.]|nr:hypothetical protein [Micropruina sp.]